MQTTLFYNTTNESGDVLLKSYEDAKNQDGIVLGLFKKYGKLSPSRAYKLLDEKYPITSIRRSINTLCSNKLIVKTDEKIMGMYGKKEHIWYLV